MAGPQTTRDPRFLDIKTSPSRQQSSQRAHRTHALGSSHESDPLLEDLSPTKTLDVFLAGSGGDRNPRRDANSGVIINGLQTASSAEKAFGVRVAQTTKQLRAWCWELEGWDWSGTFEQPSNAQRAVKRRRVSTTEVVRNGKITETRGGVSTAEGFSDPEPLSDPYDDHEDLYWGSLPAYQAQDYEKRVDDIQEQLDEMNLEELKNHVLDVHIPSRSRSSSISGMEHVATFSPAQFRHLDDYTALITATIMQALPYLSRLTSLLQIWSIRLSVSRSSASFLSELDNAQSALQIAQCLIDAGTESTSPKVVLPRDSFNREVFDTIKDDLGEKVATAGRLLDKMLDDLEGREDTIPERWIEEFEMLETRYTAWVVEAGKFVLGIESRPPPAVKDSQGPAGVPLAPDESNSSDHITLHTRDLSETEEQTHNAKHDTLTEPLRISVEKANTRDTNRTEKSARDYTPGAALSSHPPSDPPSATRTITGTLEYSLNAANKASKLPPNPPDTEMLSKAVVDSSSNTSSEGDEKQDQAEPKASVSYSAKRTTSPDNGGRRGLGAKLNALMGREDKAPIMRPTNTPVRPFERANSGFGRLFNKQRESSDSAESSASEGRRQSLDGHTKPKSKRLSLRNKRDASIPGYEKSSRHVVNDGITSLEPGDNVAEEKLESPRSTSNAASSPNSSLRRDLSDIQRAADSLATGEQSPSEETHEGFVEKSRTQPEQSYFEQENRPPQPSTSHGNALDETFEPHIPVATDDFYNMFVDSLPASPAEGWDPGLKRATKNSQRPVLSERSLTTTAAKSAELGARSSRHDLPPLTKRHTVQGLAAPESEQFKNIDPSLTHAEKSYFALTGAPRPKNGPSNMNVEKPIRRPIFKRASIASIESFPRSELKSVQIRRTDSQRSTGSRSVPQTPVSPIEASFREVPPHRPQSTPPASSQNDSPSVPRRLSNSNRPLSTTEEEESPQVRHISELAKISSPSSSAKTAKPRPNEISSQHERVPRPSDALLNATRSPSQPSKKSTTKKPMHSRTFSEEDKLERQISSILTTIPARIRLSSSPTNETPEPKSRLRTKRLVSAPGPLTPAKTRNTAETRSPTPTTPSTDSPSQPTLTLAPARSTAESRQSGGHHSHGDNTASPDTGVKLYHLIQPGRADPIKLFVRLVGEDGSRVMVRVGGGWADLGDFLREFALHHGRRTVSGEGPSRVEMVGVDGRRTTSGSILMMPEAGSGGKLRSTSRPTSALEIRRERAESSASSTGPGSASRPGSSGGTSVSSLKLRPSSAANSQLATSVEVPSPGTPTPAPVQAGVAEPDEIVRVRESTPSSTGSARIRILDEDEHDRVPLSGPFSRREMSVEKQKWVQDMLGQARKASSERVERVGGTRRVAFRGLSNASIGSNKKEDGSSDRER